MLCTGQRLAEHGADIAWTPALSRALRRAIRAELDRHEVRIGYACAAAGADLVFCEELLARGGELHLFLPCPRAEFEAQHVAPAGRAWVARFRRACARAARVEATSEDRLVGDETLLRFNNQMLQGMARVHAERIGMRARLLAIWSPSAPAAPGSPADFMDQWSEIEHLSLLDIDTLGGRGDGDPLDATLDAMADFDMLAIGTSPLVVRAIFFADLAVYSTIRDEQVPLLWDFLAEVQQRVETEARTPILINSWGDAIHAAAETASDLADYAAALVDATRTLDPAPFGLERRPLFRVALHAGPVYVGLHPLTGRSMIFGHHVNRAARIEAVATPGEIFASQHFVALLRTEMDARGHEAHLGGGAYREPYTMEYVGNLELPKRFGREEVYRILRAPPVAGMEG